jgi:formylglycine-generating enzyme required for sulfatase activity
MIHSLTPAVLLLTCAVCAWSQIEIQFVEIRAAGDSFTMGDTLIGPNVVQTLSYDFSISKHPITNDQFRGFIEDGGYSRRSCWTSNGWKWKGKTAQPAHWTDREFNSPDQPVVGVSWYEAVAYCNWLSSKDDLPPAYDACGRADLGASGYRLPTETEWEYAAAKGSPDQAERVYPWGDTWDPGNAVCSVAPARASRTATVGSRSPQGDTPQGLVDMSGNVWQWCSDNAQNDVAIAGFPRTDRLRFRNDSTNSFMVLRGGSWCNDFQNGFRAAFRSFVTLPGNRHNVIGFRVVQR